MGYKSTDGYKYLSKKLRKSNEEIDRNNCKITRHELSELMGISWDVLKKDLNGTRGAKLTRDYLIAIGIQLGMDDYEINELIEKYSLSPLIGINNYNDYKCFEREELLIEIICECFENAIKYSIDDINARLIDSGFPKLDIPSRKEKPSLIYSKFNVLETNDFVSILDSYFNFYNELESKFSVEFYKCTSFMYIRNKISKEIFRLEYNDENIMSIYKFKDEHIDLLSKISYSNLYDTGEFQPYFIILKNRCFKKIKELYEKMNDTKNYKMRTSAVFDKGNIKVFSEKFNYTIPEINEYLSVEYMNGEYKYIISSNSLFLNNQMKTEKFNKYFKGYKREVVLSSRSIESLIDDYIALSKYLNDVSEFVIKNTKKQFEQLKDEVDLLRSKLINKHEFIRNIKDNVELNHEYWLCNYYKCVDEIDFKIEKDEYETYFIPKTNSITYLDVEVDLSELGQAYELGIENLDELINIKKNFGSISNFLMNI